MDRYKSSSQKQMPKKKKQSTQTELFAYVKTAKYRFKSSHSTWWTNTQKKWQKNLKLVFHLSVSHTTIHVVKLIPCLTSKQNDDKQTKMATLMPFDDRRSRYGETHVISFVLIRQKPKFLNDTRETSLLTALLFSQFVLSSCLRTAHSERLCC